MTVMRNLFQRIRNLLLPALLIVSFGSIVYLVVERGTISMNQSASAFAPASSKPLIDIEARKETSTATFAMG